MTLSRSESAGFLVNQAARLFARHLTDALGRHGAWPAYFPILLALWEDEELTQADLVRRLDLEQPTVANTLQRMERDGFVRRVPDPSDGRTARLRLTATARAAETSLTRAAAGVNARALAGLAAAEQQQFLTMLRRVISNLRGHDDAPVDR